MFKCLCVFVPLDVLFCVCISVCKCVCAVCVFIRNGKDGEHTIEYADVEL